MPFSTLAPVDQETLAELLAQVQLNTTNFMGYPVSKDFDFTELMPFLHYPMNNLGDPLLPAPMR